MSVVLGVATKNKAIIMSDGRVSFPDVNGNIVPAKENFPKVIQINQFVCIGFTGSLDICRRVLIIIDSIEPKLKSQIKVAQLFDILYKQAKEIKKNYNDKKLVVQILVMGINEDGKIEMKSTSSNMEFSIRSQIPERIQDICFIELIPHNTLHDPFQTYLMRNKPIVDNMREYIDYIASLDTTVNTNHFQIQIDATT